MKLYRCLVFAIWTSAAAFGQAIVEHAVGTAAAGAASAGAKGAGSAVGGVFGRLTETIEKSGATGTADPVKTPAPAASSSTATSNGKPTVANSVTQPGAPGKTLDDSKPVRKATPIELSKIRDGMERAELIDLYGEPLMKFSERNSSRLLETFWYNDAASHSVTVKLIDGKVSIPAPSVRIR
jgi:hypothetical protein